MNIHTSYTDCDSISNYVKLFQNLSIKKFSVP